MLCTMAGPPPALTSLEKFLGPSAIYLNIYNPSSLFISLVILIHRVLRLRRYGMTYRHFRLDLDVHPRSRWKRTYIVEYHYYVVVCLKLTLQKANTSGLFYSENKDYQVEIQMGTERSKCVGIRGRTSTVIAPHSSIISSVISSRTINNSSRVVVPHPLTIYRCT